MQGPKPKGFWSSQVAASRGQDHDVLRVGRTYRVIRAFRDHDRFLHRVGETWLLCGWSFLPYDDGMSFFVSLDGSQEWQIRLQWRPEEQGPVLDALEAFIAPVWVERDSNAPLGGRGC